MSIFDMTTPWYEILLRTVVVYVTVLVLLRVAGKRELGQMTPFDLLVILVIPVDVMALARRVRDR